MRRHNPKRGTAMLKISALILAAALAACADPAPGPGAACEPTAAECGDGLHCADVGVLNYACVEYCVDPQPSEVRPINAPPQCDPTTTCIATPGGVDACLPLCGEGDTCENGSPGRPYLDSPNTCVCLPWQ